MGSQTFLASVMFVFTGLIAAFYHFRLHFSDGDYFRNKAYSLKEQVQRERLQAVLAQYQLEDFKQHVAGLLPAADLKGRSYEEKYPYRNLASIVNASSDEHFERFRAEKIFALGQKEFDQMNYREAKTHLQRIVDEFPSSVFVVRAHFLIGECLYQLKQKEDLVGHIEKMVSLFPEDELTGFALLRLAEVYLAEDRPEDAADIYELIVKNYRDSALVEKANERRKALR